MAIGGFGAWSSIPFPPRYSKTICKFVAGVDERFLPGRALRSVLRFAANFRFGSNCDLQRSFEPGLECADEPTLLVAGRQCGGGPI